MDNPGALSSPPGQLLDLGGTQVHWREWGTPTHRPVIVLEAGLGMMSACWGRLAPLLAAETRLIAWDRPGLGWSGEREGIREAGVVAGELLLLLDHLPIDRPFILLGHSLGAMIARALLGRVPGKLAGMIFLDAAHPEQMRHPKARWRMRNFFLFLEAAHLLAARGLPLLTLPIASELEHLPEPERQHAVGFLKHPRHLRTTARESRGWDQSCLAAAPIELGDLPLLVISAQKHCLPGWPELQQDLTTLSPHSTHVTFTDATHISLLTRADHAARTAEAILNWLRKV